VVGEVLRQFDWTKALGWLVIQSDDESMTRTVECRRCGYRFETAAVTNTRCRNCRSVVGIGRSAPAAEVQDREDLPEEEGVPVIGAVLVIGLATVIVLAVIGSAVRSACVRRRLECPPFRPAESGQLNDSAVDPEVQREQRGLTE
jgi:hypothetical protein